MCSHLSLGARNTGVRGGWHAVLTGSPTWWLIANEVGTRLMLSAVHTKSCGAKFCANCVGQCPSGLYTNGRVYPPITAPGKVTNNSGDLGTIRVTPSHGGHDAEAMVAPP